MAVNSYNTDWSMTHFRSGDHSVGHLWSCNVAEKTGLLQQSILFINKKFLLNTFLLHTH